MYIKENGENTASIHSETFLSHSRYAWRDFGKKSVLLEKLLVQRSHRISDNKNIREKIGTLCTAALKYYDNIILIS